MVFGKFKKALKSGNDADNSFSGLDDIIHSNETNIVLESDFELKESRLKNQQTKYMQGIILNTDNQVIDGAGHTIDATDKVRVFYVTARNVTIKNVTIKNGNFMDGSGGAINIENGASLKLVNVKMIDNTSKTEGGAISNFGELTIIDSTLRNNVAHNDGGALYNHADCVLNIENTEIHDNHASRYGGAICNQTNALLNIKDSTITKNTADDTGGGNPQLRNSKYFRLHL